MNFFTMLKKFFAFLAVLFTAFLPWNWNSFKAKPGADGYGAYVRRNQAQVVLYDDAADEYSWSFLYYGTSVRKTNSATQGVLKDGAVTGYDVYYDLEAVSEGVTELVFTHSIPDVGGSEAYSYTCECKVDSELNITLGDFVKGPAEVPVVGEDGSGWVVSHGHLYMIFYLDGVGELNVDEPVISDTALLVESAEKVNYLSVDTQSKTSDLTLNYDFTLLAPGRATLTIPFACDGKKIVYNFVFDIASDLTASLVSSSKTV